MTKKTLWNIRSILVKLGVILSKAKKSFVDIKYPSTSLRSAQDDKNDAGARFLSEISRPFQYLSFSLYLSSLKKHTAIAVIGIVNIRPMLPAKDLTTSVAYPS